MKLNFICLLLALFAFLQLSAQDYPELKSIDSSQIIKLLKEHKDIHFVRTYSSAGTELKYYVTPSSQQYQSKNIQPVVNGTESINFHLTKDVNAQTDANPASFIILKDIIYFSANNGTHGTELWRSDGTAAGTFMVADLEPGETSSTPSQIITSKNKLFFITQNSITNVNALWKSDGTASGTVKIKDLSYSSFNLTDVDGIVYFFDTYNPQLWKTDGNAANTIMVKDFSSSAQSTAALGISANGLFYFTIITVNNGRELWRSNGTDAGTFMVKDISPYDFYYDAGPEQLTPVADKLYFSELDSTGRKLWLTDGTEVGTVRASGQDSIYLPSDFDGIYNNEPFVVQNDFLYTSAYTAATGTELFRYNIVENTKGFSVVKNISAGSAGGFISNITGFNNYVAFQYQDTLNKKTELWRSDGTPGNTKLIKAYDLYSSYFTNLTAASESFLYFTTYSPDTGIELWKTDGLPENTALVKDIYVGATSANPTTITALKK